MNRTSSFDSIVRQHLRLQCQYMLNVLVNFDLQLAWNLKSHKFIELLIKNQRIRSNFTNKNDITVKFEARIWNVFNFFKNMKCKKLTHKCVERGNVFTRGFCGSGGVILVGSIISWSATIWLIKFFRFRTIKLCRFPYGQYSTMAVNWSVDEKQVWLLFSMEICCFLFWRSYLNFLKFKHFKLKLN